MLGKRQLAVAPEQLVLLHIGRPTDGVGQVVVHIAYATQRKVDGATLERSGRFVKGDDHLALRCGKVECHIAELGSSLQAGSLIANGSRAIEFGLVRLGQRGGGMVGHVGHHFGLAVLVELYLLKRIVSHQSTLGTFEALQACGAQHISSKAGIPQTELVKLTVEVIAVHKVGSPRSLCAAHHAKHQAVALQAERGTGCKLCHIVTVNVDSCRAVVQHVQCKVVPLVVKAVGCASGQHLVVLAQLQLALGIESSHHAIGMGAEERGLLACLGLAALKPQFEGIILVGGG